ncbi:MAG: hypothetical protein KKI02_07560 [Planctomycetes bacterium]|jgi:hypothetical protein|nr:hypothetical protein [Planctomycetota bacterium]
MKTAATVMLTLGIILALVGHAQWAVSHRNAVGKLPWLASQIIPGWSLMIMGWTGLVAERFSRRGSRDD